VQAIAVPLRESTPSGGPENFYDHLFDMVTRPGSPKPVALSFFREVKRLRRPMSPSTAAPLSHKFSETEDIKT